MFNIVAELDGNVVGTVFFRKHQTHDMMRPVTQITAMIVDEKHRGTGIGKRLLLEVENWSRECESSHLLLNTSENATSAKAFYEHCGFICSGNRRLSKELS